MHISSLHLMVWLPKMLASLYRYMYLGQGLMSVDRGVSTSSIHVSNCTLKFLPVLLSRYELPGIEIVHTVL